MYSHSEYRKVKWNPKRTPFKKIFEVLDHRKTCSLFRYTCSRRFNNSFHNNPDEPVFIQRRYYKINKNDFKNNMNQAQGLWPSP